MKHIYKTSNAINFKKSFRRAGWLFETITLWQIVVYESTCLYFVSQGLDHNDEAVSSEQTTSPTGLSLLLDCVLSRLTVWTTCYLFT